MTFLWYGLTVTGGFIIGFIACALLSVNRIAEEKESYLERIRALEYRIKELQK